MKSDILPTKGPVILSSFTSARVGLGRCGDALPTAPLLRAQLDHASARDAVHAPLDPSLLSEHANRAFLCLKSRSKDRRHYLASPVSGRRLDPVSAAGLEHGVWDLAVVIADGLSATAIHSHALPTIDALTARLTKWRIAPLTLVRLGRVAIGDEIAVLLGADCVLVLIGERPGMSTVDSLGAYLTWNPRIGCRDNERNCVSNIRPPAGLSYDAAADLLAWLLIQARDRQTSGVTLKDKRPLAIARIEGGEY